MATRNDQAPYFFHQGSSERAYDYLGFHRTAEGDVFRVWAPNADAVSVVGDFNGWDPAAAPMHEIDMVVEDVDRVCDYARDLAQEYAGDIDIQRFDEDGVSCANLYIDLPQANAAEFFEAIRHFDRSDAGLEGYDVNGETSMLLVLRSE